MCGYQKTATTFYKTIYGYQKIVIKFISNISIYQNTPTNQIRHD